MTTSRSPLTVLCHHVIELSRRAEGDLAIKRFAEAGLEVSQAADLSALLRQCGRGVDRTRRAQLVEFLVDLAPYDEIAALCVLVTLRPELMWMSRLSVRGPVDPEEAEAEVVAVAWEMVTRPHDCGGEAIGHRTLVNGIWTEVRRSAGLRRRALLDVIPLAHDFDRQQPEDDPLERWPGLLAAAVARGVLTPRQVVVIAQTRMDRRPLREVAFAHGRTYDSLRMERARAETALREFALGYLAAEDQ